MMRKLDTNDFETANIEYVEFWLLDPLIYTRDKGGDYGGDFYLNLGEVSEDILHDGKKFFESGMPIDGNSNYYTETAWGRVPNTTSVVYAFNNESGARERQDIGLNGLNSEEERTFGAYREFLMAVQGKVSPQVYDSLMNDPAGDDYHYFRGRTTTPSNAASSTVTSISTCRKATRGRMKTQTNRTTLHTRPHPTWKTSIRTTR